MAGAAWVQGRGLQVRSGLTLVEMLVVMGIFGVLLAVVSMSMVMSHRSYVSSEAYVTVQQEARRALDNMVKELREAGGTIAAVGAQLDFQVALGYNLAPPCPLNAVCWGARDQNGTVQFGWSLRYRVNGTQLVREIRDAGGVVQPGTRVLANYVSQLSFVYVGGTTRTLTVQLQVQRTSPQLGGGSMALGLNPLVVQIKLRNG